MVELTIDFIQKKSKSTDLSTIKKLNCWACNLIDITELRHLTQVEILTLSVNKIKSLESLKNCLNLKELYIRNNEIDDLNQLFYLKNLQHLKILWLADNPCALDVNYRIKVLKILPNLQKLDNATVSDLELEESKNLEIELRCPEEVEYEQANIVNENDLDEIHEISSKLSSILSDGNEKLSDDDKTELFTDNDAIINTIDSTEPNLPFSIEETNKLRKELGLPELKLRSETLDTLPSMFGNQSKRNISSNVLSAILTLIQDCDEECLETIIKQCQLRREALKNLTRLDA